MTDMTTRDVRSVYQLGAGEWGVDHEAPGAEFDRWLSAHDAAIVGEFIAWADRSPAVTWAGALGLKERWVNRDNPEYQEMLRQRGEEAMS